MRTWGSLLKALSFCEGSQFQASFQKTFLLLQMNFTLRGSVQERHSSQLLSPHQSLVNLLARLVPGHWVPERDRVCDTGHDWSQRQLWAGRQSGVKASKWSLPTFIVSNTALTHFLLLCLKDKTNWFHHISNPISPQVFSLILLGKSQRPQWKINDGFTDKITNEKITPLYTLQLLFPLLYLLFSFPINNSTKG